MPALVRPAVSIVICNFNYARFLGEAIDSAVAQDLPCQVVVVDDGSTDGSPELLHALHSRPGTAGRFEVVQQRNAGQLAAYNAGFARCSGEVVMFLDADDALEPHAARVVSARFGEGIAKVHFRMALVDEDGRPTGASVPATLASGDVLTPLLRFGLLYASPPGSGNAYRTAALRSLFPLPVDPSDRVGADFFTIYGSVAFGGVAACEETLARYRLHRRSGDAGDALVFGNAALGNEESKRVVSRYARLRALVALATDGTVNYAARFHDFSVQKVTFAAAVLERPYWRALLGSGEELWPLLRSIWLQPHYRAAKKFGLTAWAALMLTVPSGARFRLARYVCNPASRSA